MICLALNAEDGDERRSSTFVSEPLVLLAAQGNDGSAIGDFIAGIFGTLKLLIVTAQNFLKPSGVGSAAVDRALQETWGQGSGAYRLGFVAGCVIYISLIGGGSSAASGRKSQPNSEADAKAHEGTPSGGSDAQKHGELKL
jgi:hypothetical protein